MGLITKGIKTITLTGVIISSLVIGDSYNFNEHFTYEIMYGQRASKERVLKENIASFERIQYLYPDLVRYNIGVFDLYISKTIDSSGNADFLPETTNSLVSLIKASPEEYEDEIFGMTKSLKDRKGYDVSRRFFLMDNEETRNNLLKEFAKDKVRIIYDISNEFIEKIKESF